MQAVVEEGPELGKLEDLIAEVENVGLRRLLAAAAREVKESRNFGLVFEQHIPETVAVLGLPVRRGNRVRLRNQIDTGPDFTVIKATKKALTLASDGTTLDVEPGDVAVVKRFGEAIYPTLTPVGEVRRSDGPAHTVINGENYHALQTLLYLYEGQVDCIYIDPPYNTGARDWKYNNRFVDDNDSWRHSKWLSFMEKRLVLAKRLLKDTGVLVVTIDEHEVHHLGMLIERLFPECRRPMVTIVMNSAGNTQSGFYRVEEYALFCFPPGTRPALIGDDLLADESKKPRSLWGTHIRSGGINDRPSKRPNLVYPIGIDRASGRFVGCGRSLEDRLLAGELGDMTRAGLDEWRPDPDETYEGHPVLWPHSKDGSIGTWRNDAVKFAELVADGFVRIRPNPAAPGSNEWSVSYVTEGNRKKVADGVIPILGRDERDGALILGDDRRPVIPKTVWKRRLHDATNWGSPVLRSFVGANNFSYPKSPYAVRDTLATIVGDKPSALVLDFFAGSGTTLQATCMLNAQDGGTRRAILVTNNEVGEQQAQSLIDAGHYPGDPEWEACGIFEAVAKPRCSAVVSGLRQDDTPVEGEYADGTPYAEGFAESVEFYNLDYLDPDSVRLGDQLNAIIPMLRLAAGAFGATPHADDDAWLIPEASAWAVLIDDARFGKFKAALDKHPELTHIWLVTTSEEAFARMRAQLPPGPRVSMLYRDYLRNFEINTEQS